MIADVCVDDDLNDDCRMFEWMIMNDCIDYWRMIMDIFIWGDGFNSDYTWDMHD